MKPIVYLCFHLVLNSVASLFGDIDADISLHIVALLLGHGVGHGLLDGGALLPGHGLAFLPRDRLALLPKNKKKIICLHPSLPKLLSL